jgi:predicted RND superfamily exporter protein
MWTFGFGLFNFSNRYLPSNRNGIPNCIFLTNKYQQEYVAHGNTRGACNYKVGTATLMTNLTTAAGFATLSLPIANY